jgi:hypothetical protein
VPLSRLDRLTETGEQYRPAIARVLWPCALLRQSTRGGLEQDNDPLMNTDCRTGTPPVFPGRANDVRAAELQLYSSEHRVRGAELADEDGHGHHH